MSSVLTDQIISALAAFTSATRLYELTIEGAAGGSRDALLVEAFSSLDGVQEIGARDVIAMSLNAHLDLSSLLGSKATLLISLADGSRTSFVGDVSEASMLGCDGGLTRYRVRISQWMWRLSQVRNSRVWQDKSIVEIVESVFEAYLPIAIWRWSDEAGPFMAEGMARSYCCQYRESDLAFADGTVKAAVTGEESTPLLILDKNRVDRTKYPRCPNDQKAA